MIRRTLACGLAWLALAFASQSCRSATEITLRIRTNLSCSDQRNWRGIAVYVGNPGQDVEQASPTLVTQACDAQGNVGSLVVVPSSSKSAEVGIRVVAGLSRPPEECQEKGYKGCIVARRALRFTPHDDLALDIELDSDCVSVGCDANNTCIAGSCQAAQLKEAPPPEMLAPNEPSVRCGDDGVRCPTSGNVCCLKVDGDKTSGDCRRPELCEPPNIVLNCDDDSDCPASDGQGNWGLCAVSYTPHVDTLYTPVSVALSDCRFNYIESTAQAWTIALCENRKSCVNGAYNCIESHGSPTNPLPGYYWCEVPLMLLNQ